MSVFVAVHKNNKIAITYNEDAFIGDQRIKLHPDDAKKVIPFASGYIGMTRWKRYKDILLEIQENEPIESIESKAELHTFMLSFIDKLQNEYNFVNEQCDGENYPFLDIDADFLYICRNGIFFVSCMCEISHIQDYFSIGTGSDFASGAIHALFDSELDAEAIAVKAAEVAAALDQMSSGPVRVETLEW